MMKCSSFEAIVAHVWRARTKAVFNSPNEISSVLFVVDIRAKMSPPLPDGFMGNAVVSASVSAQVVDMDEKPFSFCVKKVREGIKRVTDEYVRSVIDWLEVHKEVPSTANGNFYVSAWWKLPFYELDFGYGKPIYGGPVVSGMDEFVLLLSHGNGSGKEGWDKCLGSFGKKEDGEILMLCYQVVNRELISLLLFSIISTPKDLNYNNFSSVPCFSAVFSAEKLQCLLPILDPVLLKGLLLANFLRHELGSESCTSAQIPSFK